MRMIWEGGDAKASPPGLYADDPGKSASAVPVRAAMTARLDALAGDDGDHRGHAGSGDGYLAAGDRAGERGIIFAAAAATAGIQLLNRVLAGREASDNERLIKLRAAACAQGKGLAAGIARAGDADGERARRAALVAARLQQNLMDDQRGTVVVLHVSAAEVGRIAQQGMFPLREGTIGKICAIARIERMAARHHKAPP